MALALVGGAARTSVGSGISARHGTVNNCAVCKKDIQELVAAALETKAANTPQTTKMYDVNSTLGIEGHVPKFRGLPQAPN